MGRAVRLAAACSAAFLLAAGPAGAAKITDIGKPPPVGYWTAVNNAGQVAGTVYTGPLTIPNAARWQNGTVTELGSAGTYGTAIDGAGLVGGNRAQGTITAPAYWDANGEHLLAEDTTPGEASGFVALSENGYATINVNGGVQLARQAPFAYTAIPGALPGGGGGAVNDLGHVVGTVRRTGSTSVFGPWSSFNAGALTDLAVIPWGPAALNDLDEVVGTTLATSNTTRTQAVGNGTSIVRELQAPTGAVDRSTQAMAIADDGTVVGRTSIAGATGSSGVIWHGSTPELLESLLPAGSGWTNVVPADISANGNFILGQGTFNGEFNHFFLIDLGIRHLTGKALAGTDGLTLDAPEKPVAGLVVDVSGTTSEGTRFSGTAKTATDGTYDLKLPAGTYKASLPDQVCVRGLKGCVHEAKVDTTAGDAKVDLVAVTSPLRVTVTPKPGRVTLDTVPKSLKGKGGKTVQVSVTVKNAGTQPVTGVKLLDKLNLRYDDGKALVERLPLIQEARPAPKLAIGTLKPGQTSKPVVFTLTAKGDGAYAIEAIALARQPSSGASLRAAGKGILNVGSPLLVFKARHAPIAKLRGLFPSGKQYTVKVTLRNVSYRRSVTIIGPRPQLSGNAVGALPVARGAKPSPQSMESCDVKLTDLGPRQTKEVDVVVYTQHSDERGRDAGSLRGGTRSIVEFAVPTGAVEDVDGTERALKPSEVDIDEASRRLELSLREDNRPSVAPPAGAYGALEQGLYFTLGFHKAAADLIVGTVNGLLSLNASDLAHRAVDQVPLIYKQYVAFEAEMWDVIRKDPALLASYVGGITNAYARAAAGSRILGPKLLKVAGQVEAAITAHHEKIWNEYYAGDWRGAMLEMGKESGDVVLTAVTSVPSFGACVLAKSGQIFKAAGIARTAAYARVAEELAIGYPGLVDAFEGWAAIQEKLRPGQILELPQIRKFYGLTVAQAQQLAAYAKANKLVLTLRGRATQAIRHLADGAVLKGEQIKIKSVSWLDAQFLGYRADDIGLVVLRKPPTRAEVLAKLRKQGIHPDTAPGREVLGQWQHRVDEYTAKATDRAKRALGEGGLFQDLEADAKAGEMRMRWNVSANSIDPSLATDGYQTYKFRLNEFPPKSGNFRAEYFANGRYRPVTGDIDFLSIVKATSYPLEQVKRLKVYRDLAASFGGLLHPAVDTWEKYGLFKFDAKIREFTRSGISLQVGADGVFRTVEFDQKASFFKTAENYLVYWRGGYQHMY